MEKKMVDVDDALTRFLVDETLEKYAFPSYAVVGYKGKMKNKILPNYLFEFAFGDSRMYSKPPHIHVHIPGNKMIKMTLTKPYRPLDPNNTGGLSKGEIADLVKLMEYNNTTMEKAKMEFDIGKAQHDMTYPKTREKREEMARCAKKKR